MLRDITLGQYYPADSVIHKLDPRVKLFSTMIYIISLFCFRGVAALAIATVFLITVIKLSKVPFKFMVMGLKAIMILMLITAVFNLFLTPGEALVSVWRFTITKEGVTSAVLMAIRLTYLILGTSIMTLTTTPNQLTDGLEKALMPLSKIGVPVHAIAMMMSIPLLVPLFVSAFRRADDLAMAMEARCYNGGEGRTKMKPLRYEGRDRLSYLIMWLYLALIILCRIFVPWPQ